MIGTILWYPIAIFRAIMLLIGMVLYMAVYGLSLLISKHTKERALNLRANYLKYWAIPLLGIKVEIEGEPISSPALYVANHRSFSDPIVICNYLKAFVIAKAEVANYPIINKGAELTGVLYVKRNDKTSRNEVREMMIDTIGEGYNVLIFPEGTVGVEKGTIPFKVGAFAEAVKNNIPIVPIAIEYKSKKDLWLIPSFIPQFLMSYAKPFTHVKLTFGPPIVGDDVEQVVTSTKHWIDAALDHMQHDWTDISFY